MQHIWGRKSLIGNTKLVTVLSYTGTMHFIIWGFVGIKGSGLIYLFPSSTCDLGSKFPCCQPMPSSYVSYTIRTCPTRWPRLVCISLHTRTDILQAIHHGSCWQHCYLVLCCLADFKVHHSPLQLVYSMLKVDLVLVFFTFLVTLTTLHNQCESWKYSSLLIYQLNDRNY